MTDRPILFSSPMVLALLAGQKTQTRRLPSPGYFRFFEQDSPLHGGPMRHFRLGLDDLAEAFTDVLNMRQLPGTDVWTWSAPVSVYTPDGKAYREHHPFQAHLVPAVGDRLWCRESWAVDDDGAPLYMAGERGPQERFDGQPVKWKPSIHMPKKMSRLWLTVTGARLERLHDISDADAKAEGAGLYVPGHGFITQAELEADPGYANFLAPRMGYEAIWRELHDKPGRPGGWDSNPWVIVISFGVTLGNIDRVGA